MSNQFDTISATISKPSNEYEAIIVLAAFHFLGV